MNRDGHNQVKFFVGAEVEYTPAHSKRTLFVVDYQDTAEIEKHAKENRTQHIFLGANHSFNARYDTEHFKETWNEQIKTLLSKGYMVTLDYQAHEHEKVLTMLSPDIWKSRNFIPLLSVRIPKITESSINLTVKIDDIDFNATNAGVWCMHYTEVTDSNRFTHWNEYSSDEVIIRDTEESADAVTEYTSVSAPPVAEDPVPENNVVKNLVEAGLDPDGKSLLKPDENEVPVIASLDAATAAAAYTADVKPAPATPKKEKKVQ